METLSDEHLVMLSQQGNVGAFNTLSARWEASLYRFARRALGNREDARDVCQEALLRAYLNITRLRDGQKFKAWVHHIAWNLCRDRFRSRASHPEVRSFEELREGEELGAPARTDPVGQDALKRRRRRALQRILNRLPAEQRTAILLREYQGFTSEEIGEITGVPAATVRTRIFYGLRSMRRMLQEQGIA